MIARWIYGFTILIGKCLLGNSGGVSKGAGVDTGVDVEIGMAVRVCSTAFDTAS